MSEIDPRIAYLDDIEVAPKNPWETFLAVTTQIDQLGRSIIERTVGKEALAHIRARSRGEPHTEISSEDREYHHRISIYLFKVWAGRTVGEFRFEGIGEGYILLTRYAKSQAADLSDRDALRITISHYPPRQPQLITYESEAGAEVPKIEIKTVIEALQPVALHYTRLDCMNQDELRALVKPPRA